ncbi:MAG TPA: hypothetical protein VEC37_07945 [Bacillota bacterium]|nr:hypothetical protein [Bacillota bacterium]
MLIINKLKILCEDTFFRGAFCGTVAGILKDFIDLLFSFSHIKELFFWSFAGVLAYGRLPEGAFMNLIGFVWEIIFSGFLGVLFALIASQIKTRHYLLMGIFYGSMAWFFIRAAVVCYKIEELKTPNTPFRPLITWSLSMLYGIIIAWMERKLSPKTS